MKHTLSGRTAPRVTTDANKGVDISPKPAEKDFDGTA